MSTAARRISLRIMGTLAILLGCYALFLGASLVSGIAIVVGVINWWVAEVIK